MNLVFEIGLEEFPAHRIILCKEWDYLLESSVF